MQGKHNLSLENRKILNMTGIIDVESSNDTSVKLNTELGKLLISGTDMSIEIINTETGDFSLKGEIKKIEYKTSGNSGKFSSLFK